MFSKKIQILLVGFLLLYFGNPGVEAAVKFDPTVINVGLQFEPTTLDPHTGTSAEIGIIHCTNQPLWRVGPNLEKIPVLATSWETSKDGRIHTYHLRKGVKFHDGTEFNAQAVEFNINRIKHFKRGPAWVIEALDHVETVDDYTVRFHLENPSIVFETGMYWILFLSPTYVKKHEKKRGDYAATWCVDHGCGTGPYKLAEWIHGTRVVHEKFREYWDGWEGKHVEKVVNWVINEQATQRMMLETGELDFIQLFSTDHLPYLKQNPDIVVKERIGPLQLYIRLNNAVGPTKDIRIRKALSYAFDRKKYDEVLGFRNPPADGPLPSFLLGGWRPENMILEYNLEKADKLFTEAGYPLGKRPEFEFAYVKGDDLKRKLGEVLQLRLKEIGVKVNLAPSTWAHQYARLVAWKEKKTEKGAIDLWAWCRESDLPIPYGWLRVTYGKDGIRNLMGYENPEVFRLIEKSATMVDAEKRMDLWRKIVQMIADDVPDIFVSRMPDWAIFRTWVKGYWFHPLTYNRIFFYDIYKEMD